jgi:hypothetical protein
MPVVTLSIFGGVGAQFFSNDGVPLSGGLIYSYLAGTTTPATTYTTVSGAIAHTNPIVLDAGGRVPSSGEIWLNFFSKYKFVLKNSSGVLIATYDNVGGSFNASPILANFTGNGSQTVFNLASSPASEDTTNIYINGVYQQKNTYSVATNVITFSQAPPYTATIEVNYV